MSSEDEHALSDSGDEELTEPPKTLEEKQKFLEDTVADMKKEFEETKKQILDDIPESYKAGFREIGFVKWQKDWLPVLVVSPFDIPQGPVRDTWIQMYERVSSAKSTLRCVKHD